MIGTPRVFPLRDGKQEGAFLRFMVNETKWLDDLPPGLHHLRCSVTRGGRRAECDQEIWYWAGLTGWEDGKRFTCSSQPTNLHWPDCVGFERRPYDLIHRADGSRQHQLAFEIGSTVTVFRWSRSGTFLETYERRAGHVPAFEAKPLGVSLPASAESALWLRIWRIPPVPAELCVNGITFHHFNDRQGRASFDVSLAHLATRFPSGGEVMLICAGFSNPVASFHQTLVVQSVMPANGIGLRGVSLKFREHVEWVRPVVHDLLAGCTFECEGKALPAQTELQAVFGDVVDRGLRASSLASVTFSDLCWPSLPKLNCEYARDEQGMFLLALQVPREGWPTGIWTVEMQTKRREKDSWQVATGPGGCRFPVVITPKTSSPSVGFAGRVLLAADLAATGTAEVGFAEDLDPGSRGEAVRLLSRLQLLFLQPPPESIRTEVGWLEGLRGELAQLVGCFLQEADADDARLLLKLAAAEFDGSSKMSANDRCLFATVPALLALPCIDYASIGSDFPLARSLKWISELPEMELFPTIAENRLGFLESSVWLAFARLNLQVPTDNQGFRFDFGHYWQQVVGHLGPDDHADEWLGDSALGHSHAAWAYQSLGAHYQTAQRALDRAKELGAVNRLLHCEADFRCWLESKLYTVLRSMSQTDWQSPWLSVESPVDFVQSAARFMSLLALANRASAHGHLRFSDIVAWLGDHGDNRRALAWLVTLGPELLGYYLMFWELMLRTSPQD